MADRLLCCEHVQCVSPSMWTIVRKEQMQCTASATLCPCTLRPALRLACPMSRRLEAGRSCLVSTPQPMSTMHC